ncbi:4-phosphopantoate--beta-alanine ligase [Methanothermobacter sp. K4]|uniref:4-phosphopantoate--beta-alanine ligase n=1 Tax=Methanothermobacter sp. K4 TaxID=2913262 RepID=UPI001EDB876D|nr:4-phosphopantoate--beta-alanine ligase [Methanothermobacter sp. K4]MCG2828439.1 phosphopantothenate/pantothenate synthetase [Methanothermobacter sp. K4]
MISRDHPRYHSLIQREKITDAWRRGILADSGMIAHGRGEAFDYLLGEETTEPARKAIRAAAAALLLSEKPVISVNGNTAALVPAEVVELAGEIGGKIEINLFHRTEKRVKLIEEVLREHGASEVLGTGELVHIDGIMSPRATASPEGIYSADTVLVPLEDGDRTEILRKSGKTVITVDLNPLSRTSRRASISITDNIVRALPALMDAVRELRGTPREELEGILREFDNTENLRETIKLLDIRRYNPEVESSQE